LNESHSIEENRSWNVEGIVRYIGAICPPNIHNTPPCDGPYPNYTIVVYKIPGEEIANKTTTNEKGYFRMLLAPGNYVIYTRAGVLQTDLKANYFTVEKYKPPLLLKLEVDEGIR
jgi:hypothetical protein